MAAAVDAEGEGPTGTIPEVERHAYEVANRCLSLPPSSTDVLEALAVNAVRIVAQRRGISPPSLPNAVPPSSALEDMLLDEAQWLRSANNAHLRSYLPELGRALAATDQHGARERITSRALVEVITTIVSAHAPTAQDRTVRIFDPAAGTGTLVLRVAESIGSSDVVVRGQDINASVSLIANANAFLSDIDATFTTKDTLLEDPFPNESFDLAIADAPYGLSWNYLSDSLEASDRYPAGLPRRSDSSLLFTQILVSKLKSPTNGGGRAVMLCAPAPLTEPSGAKIRQWFLDQDLIEAIVALPERLSTETNIRLFALVLNNAKQAAWIGKIQVIDLRGSYVDAPTEQPERRRISSAGLDELGRAIARPRPSALARPVSRDHFRFRAVDVVHAAVTRSLRGGTSATVVPAWVPLHETIEEWSRRRYAVGRTPEISLPDRDVEVRLDVSAVFPDPVEREAPAELRRLSWPGTSLACVATSFGYVRSVGAADRDSELAAFPDGRRYLAIPVEPHKDAVVTESLESVPDSRCFLIDSDFGDIVDHSFIAAWLNSPGGRAARRSALVRAGATSRGSSLSIRTLSRTHIAQYLDAIIVAVPPMATQREVARTAESVEAASRAVSAAAQELWQNPDDLHQLQRRLELLSESESLAEWARRLPYPLAGALWVYETEKHLPARATAHLLRFWEATAEFMAAVFLSVLEGDRVLRAREFRTLRTTLAKSGLSLDRASFGTWVTVAQRLAKTFRSQLQSEDPDAAEKILQLFGNPQSDLVSRLLSEDIGRSLGHVNALRNQWLGHAGATTDAQAQEQVEVLVRHTEELRDVLASSWDQYRLVRAGRMARREERFYVEVEVAHGPTTPFPHDEIVLADPVDEGRLYLSVRDGERAVPLNDLILLRAAPRSAQYTCYFYNRSEASGVRMIAYQYAEESELLADVPSVDRLLADFAAESKDTT